MSQLINKLLIGFLVFFVFYSCKVQNNSAASLAKKVDAEISYLPRYSLAGEKVRIKIQSNNLIGEDIYISWQGKFGDIVFKQRVQMDAFLYTFSKEVSKYSGRAEIKLIYDQKIIASDSIYIRALPAENKIESYIGPKTLAVDQQLESMLCTFPVDVFGNPAEDKSQTKFIIKRSHQAHEVTYNSINNLLSYLIVENSNQIGKVLIGGDCDFANIEEQEISIVPGPAQNTALKLISWHPHADNRQFIHLQTEKIFDHLDNAVSDGTEIIFNVKENDKVTGVYKSYTVNGIANVQIKNPSQATSYSISTNLDPNEKEAIKLTFVENVKSIPVEIVEGYIVIGPVEGKLGQLITDGTLVEIRSGKYKIKKTIDTGMTKVKIPKAFYESKSKTCKITIGGMSVIKFLNE